MVSRNFYSAYSTTSGTSARYYLRLFGDLRRFGDVINGGYLHEAHPPHSSARGARGRGEGVYTTSSTREEEKGVGLNVEPLLNARG